MAPDGYNFSTLQEFVGQEIGVSEWFTIDQGRINDFADCTEDHQWIHVDVERAQKESPFGSTIAHGYLTLSLLPRTQFDTGAIPPDISQAVNYGLDKVRFVSPVRPGKRIRNHVVLMSV